MRTRLLTITLAAVLALLGVVAILAYVRQANERAVNGLKAQTVMVAQGAIPAGTSLRKAQQEGLLGTEKVPDSSLTNAGVQSVTAANENKVVTGPVAKGQVLLQNMLGTSSSVTASGFVIPPGMVAVTVNLCMDEAVAEYATPGSNVAVFDTIVNGPGSQITRTCDAQHSVTNGGAISNASIANTQLVVPKAEVLAVGQNPSSASTAGGNNVTATTDPSTSSSSSNPGQVQVTLAVSQPDAERLILIEELGMPWMALLGPNSNVGFGPPNNLFSGQQP